MKTLILTLAMLMAGTVSAETDYLTGAEARAKARATHVVSTANQSCYDETYYAPVNRGPVAVVCDNGEWGLSSKPTADEGSWIVGSVREQELHANEFYDAWKSMNSIQ